MITLKVNYKSSSSELCEIGKKYDTDKSSQRNNITNLRHFHPYTLFYDDLFKNSRIRHIIRSIVTYVERIFCKFRNIWI